jgi:hypothetical protein
MNRTENIQLSTLMNKVPEVTIYFWIIKVLATTVGVRIKRGKDETDISSIRGPHSHARRTCNG